MKNMFLAIILVASFSMVSCSSSKQDEGSGPEATPGIDTAKSEISDDILGDDLSDPSAPNALDVDGDIDLLADSSPDDLLMNDSDIATVMNDPLPLVTETSQPPVMPATQISETPGKYEVQTGETLMWIAFKMFGDYSKWKELSAYNGGIKKVSPGMTLNRPPSATFNYKPSGNPYLILRGDTLGGISTKVYRTSKKWRKLWDNNRDMIKDPNLIFAGFTLYYLPDNAVAIN